MKQLQQNGGVCHGQPSISETVAQQSSVFPANRRRAEVVHTLAFAADREASNEPNDSDGNPEMRVKNTREENLRRQVKGFMVENEALREIAIPPPTGVHRCHLGVDY